MRGRPGRLAQLVEYLPYTQVAAGSSPAPPIETRMATRGFGSTMRVARAGRDRKCAPRGATGGYRARRSDGQIIAAISRSSSGVNRRVHQRLCAAVTFGHGRRHS